MSTDLRRLLAEATPGPWRWHGQLDNPNAQLIVAAVNALPDLLAVIDAAQAVCASPLHSPEMEPTVVFDALRDALDKLGEGMS